MSNIISMTPISKVFCCKNVPLDNTYRDTLTFSNSTAQFQYFYGKVKTGCAFENLTRVDQNLQLKLPTNAYNLYDCNYIIMQNANWNNKYLYAFITNIEYINPNACRVSVELDVMQTWYFDYQVQNSFVIREHVDSDAIGEHLVPENLETGEYVCNSIDNFDYSDLSVAILTSLDGELQPTEGKVINNVYSGLNVFTWSITDVTTINATLKKYISNGKESAIVAVYQFPTWCNPFGGTPSDTIASADRTISSNLTSINGYVPKNNKLFTHPYNYILCSNNEGKATTYKYEFFQNATDIHFAVKGAFVTTPSVFTYPKNYLQVAENYDNGLVISGFPQCAWVGDAFRAWLAQNKGSLAMGALGTMASLGKDVAKGMGNPVATGINLASDIGSQIASVYDHAQVPPPVHGQLNVDSLNAGMNRYKFSFYKMSIRGEFAKIIDDYFSKYGYKINALKIPNITGRPSWNYVQTLGCSITGSIPFNDISKIKSIFDSGITFWHGDWVGDYTRANNL